MLTKLKPGRPSLGRVPLSSAQKQARYRRRQKLQATATMRAALRCLGELAAIEQLLRGDEIARAKERMARLRAELQETLARADVRPK